ncbi:hypothetical protein CW304_26275 [Bacillus sp. UFRGS-B20]|nr:hypothetical protein CW304_26275 [Bacillus sp. UFRGS-B20]
MSFSCCAHIIHQFFLVLICIGVTCRANALGGNVEPAIRALVRIECSFNSSNQFSFLVLAFKNVNHDWQTVGIPHHTVEVH